MSSACDGAYILDQILATSEGGTVCCVRMRTGRTCRANMKLAQFTVVYVNWKDRNRCLVVYSGQMEMFIRVATMKRYSNQQIVESFLVGALETRDRTGSTVAC